MFAIIVCLGISCMLVVVRIQLARLAHHPFRSILLHPIGAVLVLGISLESIFRYATDQLQWKGRRLVRPKQSSHKQMEFHMASLEKTQIQGVER